MSDSESIESIGKQHINRAFGVYKDLTNIIIGNISANDHGIGIGENDALLIFFEKGDCFSAYSSDFGIAPFDQVEYLRMSNDSHVILMDRLLVSLTGAPPLIMLTCRFGCCVVVG